MSSNSAGARIRRASPLALAALCALAAAPAVAQVVSEGKATLTLQGGLGYAPVGGIADQVVGLPGSGGTRHATAFRLMAGYQFAEQLSFDVGVAHVGTMSSSAPYNGTDVLGADVTLSVLEADLVGHIPVTPNSRVDLTAGIAESSLHTLVSTQQGSLLPPGESGDDNVRRLGPTLGADLEWRLGDVVSVMAGCHVYTRVGSPKLADSASGTVKLLLVGIHLEF